MASQPRLIRSRSCTFALTFSSSPRPKFGQVPTKVAFPVMERAFIAGRGTEALRFANPDGTFVPVSGSGQMGRTLVLRNRPHPAGNGRLESELCGYPQKNEKNS